MPYTPPEMRVADGQLKAMGYQQVTGLSSVKSLTVPDGATSAMVSVEAQPVRYRNDKDGTNPTASVGMPIAAGESRYFSEDLDLLKFIEITAGAIININFYK